MAALPEPLKSLRAAFEGLSARVRRLENRSPFFGTGMHANGAGGIDSDSYASGTSGFSFKGTTGNAEFNDLTLRGGIIGNDALTNPTSPGSIYATASAFALSTSMVTKVSQTITVPAGFTSAAVTINGSIFAYNQNPAGTGVDYLYSQAWIDTVHGAATPLACTDNGGSGKNPCAMSTILTGLSGGGTFVVLLSAMTAFNSWPSHSSMTAEMSGHVTWYR